MEGWVFCSDSREWRRSRSRSHERYSRRERSISRGRSPSGARDRSFSRGRSAEYDREGQEKTRPEMRSRERSRERSVSHGSFERNGEDAEKRPSASPAAQG